MSGALIGALVLAAWWTPAFIVAGLIYRAWTQSDPAPDPVFEDLEACWNLPAFDPHGT